MEYMQQYFIEQAYTYAEAERKAREKYGEHVTILMHETVKISGGFLKLFSKEGVKLTGIIPQRTRWGQYNMPPVKEPLYAPKPAAPVKSAVNKSFEEEKEKVLALAKANTPSLKDAASPKEAAIPKEAQKDNSIKEVLDEVRTIKEKIEGMNSTGSSREEHTTLSRIDDVLVLNDFPPAYRKTILEKVRKEFSLEGLNNYDAVQNKVLEWIGESIKIYDNDKFNVKPRIMILVGPTGVGKTTTVAKLAANFGINDKGYHKRRIIIITIDEYRIGAKEQLEKYCEWMEFPFFSTADYDELKKTIAVNSEGTDLIIIDTIGKNPRDMVQLGEMKNLLEACGTLVEFHLTISASTKSSDFMEILNTFEPFNYRSVIITKMDETMRAGNVIGALAEKCKSISYITNGQKVPEHIRKASVIQFLINLGGFKVNRIKLEEKFPDKGHEQMQKWR